MPVLSVDLAYKRWADIGVCALEAGDGEIVVSPISLGLGLSGAPTAAAVAEEIAELAERRGARLVLLDGPQAWKDPNDGFAHSRCCERGLNTQGKTCLPGFAKPGNYAAFFAFSIEVFDRLHALGWPRLPAASALASRSRFSLESFPKAAWSALGLKYLPAKRRCTAATVATKLAELRRLFPLSIPTASPLTHDELQAIVAGLAGIAVDGHDTFAFDLRGADPFVLERAWREGFIVRPTLRQKAQVSSA